MEATSGDPSGHPLAALIGGPRGAIESMLPPVVFVAIYLATSSNLTAAVISALFIGLVLAGLRLSRGERPVRVVGALLVVVLAATVAYYTGSAVAYFWPLCFGQCRIRLGVRFFDSDSLATSWSDCRTDYRNWNALAQRSRSTQGLRKSFLVVGAPQRRSSRSSSSADSRRGPLGTGSCPPNFLCDGDWRCFLVLENY